MQSSAAEQELLHNYNTGNKCELSMLKGTYFTASAYIRHRVELTSQVFALHVGKQSDSALGRHEAGTRKPSAARRGLKQPASSGIGLETAAVYVR
jgi:DNA-binding transcriptional regulator YiaG